MIAAMPIRHANGMKKQIPEHSWNDVADAYHAGRFAHKLLTMEENLSDFIFHDYRTT
jgi:hypothetical protein